MVLRLIFICPFNVVLLSALSCGHETGLFMAQHRLQSHYAARHFKYGICISHHFFTFFAKKNSIPSFRSYMSKKSRLAILASGSGSNAEAILNYFRDHSEIEVALLMSNNPQAYVLERARKFDIPSKVFSRAEFNQKEAMMKWLNEEKITHIVLAGFLWLVPDFLIHAYPHKIINIHPALLPKFGGKGMYGIKVHEAVKLAQEKETGITIHVVNEKYDDGEILFQGKCAVEESDSPTEIARKVVLLEHAAYPKVIEKWILRNPPAGNN